MDNAPAEAELLAIVSVPHEHRVRCGNPGCGHSVWRRIHVAQEGSELLVLGSKCYLQRYGARAPTEPRYGGGQGRALTVDERDLLASNTRALLAEFERERQRAMEAARAAQESAKPAPPPLPALAGAACTPQRDTAPSRPGPVRVFHPPDSSPWPWRKPLSSMMYFRLHDETGWVRVQHTDSRQFFAPWPVLEGWEEALPASLGNAEPALGAVALRDVVAGVAWMRAHAHWEKLAGYWREITAEIARRDRPRETD